MTAATAPRTDEARLPAVDGVHYVVTGDPCAERTVVLLHGFADNLSTWARVVAPLAVAHRVIAIDLPGFGRTTRAWTAPLCAGYLDVIDEVLAAEQVIGPVTLVGNSMGAVTAALFAATHPERTHAVALLDPPGLGSTPLLWQLAFSAPAEVGLRTADRLLPGRLTRRTLSTFYSHIAATRPNRLEPAVWQEFVAPYAAREGLAGLAPLGRALLRDLAALHLPSVIAGLDVPTLVVFGEHDLLTPVRRLRHLVGGRHRTVVLPDCGHCPQLDQPAALLGELLPFLQAAGTSANGHIARTA